MHGGILLFANRQWKRLDYKNRSWWGMHLIQLRVQNIFIHEKADMIMRITINILDENNLGIIYQFWQKNQR